MLKVRLWARAASLSRYAATLARRLFITSRSMRREREKYLSLMVRTRFCTTRWWAGLPSESSSRS